MKRVLHKGMRVSRYALFIDKHSNFTFDYLQQPLFKNGGNEHLSVAELVFGVFTLLMASWYSLINTLQTFSFMHCPISLWIAVKNFLTEVVEQNQRHDTIGYGATMISQKFHELQKLSDFINSSWGLFYFISLLDSIAWLATDSDVGLKTKDWAMRGSVSWHFANITLFSLSPRNAQEMNRKLKFYMLNIFYCILGGYNSFSVCNNFRLHTLKHGWFNMERGYLLMKMN